MTGRGEAGGGESRPRPDGDDASLVLHEERATAGKRWTGVGHLRARRSVERERVRGEYPRRLEQLAHERVPVAEDDSGKIETLPDGSISIPLYEEELVVTTRTVLRERVIVRKELVTDWQRVEAELRREHVSFDTDDVPAESVTGADGSKRRPGQAFLSGETKPFFLTSEFFAVVLAIVGVAIATLVSSALGASFFLAVAAGLISVYAISRGFAKAGSAPGPRDT